MAIEVRIPTILRTYTDGAKSVEGTGGSLSELIDDLEARLSQLEGSLPVDWHARPTFTAKVMSAVSRAVAKADASQATEKTLQRALRDSLQLASDEQERS